MKKLFFIFSLLFFFFSFAAIDTDSDGVSDEKDVCPRVYARSTTGCPTLSEVKTPTFSNICYQSQNTGIILSIQPVCDATTKTCPIISGVSGLQVCDPIFPLILQDGKPFVRGGIYIVGFSR